MKNITWKPFNKRIKIKAGMILKVVNEEIGGTFLVGDVNLMFGYCDDCTYFEKKDTVMTVLTLRKRT